MSNTNNTTQPNINDNTFSFPQSSRQELIEKGLKKLLMDIAEKKLPMNVVANAQVNIDNLKQAQPKESESKVLCRKISTMSEESWDMNSDSEEDDEIWMVW